MVLTIELWNHLEWNLEINDYHIIPGKRTGNSLIDSSFLSYLISYRLEKHFNIRFRSGKEALWNDEEKIDEHMLFLYL